MRMHRREGLSRREAIGLGVGAVGLLSCAKSILIPTADSAGTGYFGAFGVDEALIRAALGKALSRGGDFAELFFQHRVTNGLGLEDGRVNRARTQVELGVGVRVVQGDQTGYAFTEDLSRESLERAAATAAAVAAGPARAEPRRFHVRPGVPRRYEPKIRWESVTTDKKLPLMMRLNERALSADARVKKATVYFSDESSAILVADSAGRLTEDFQPLTDLSLSLVVEKDGRRESNGYATSARAGFELYDDACLDRVLKEALDQTLVLLDAAQPISGEMPVVLAAGSSGILLHEAIGHGMEADFNRKGQSIFSDKIGKKVAEPFVSIVDDAGVPRSRGSIDVDDEGSPAGRTTLVENGVLASFMHDEISARHYGLASTSNGRRQSYAYPPMPRMRSTYLLPGPHKKEEIIASVKRGVYCQTFTNGQVNIGPGDFTFYVKNGWLIEDGKLVRPIKDVNVIGNGPKVLAAIDMVADDLEIDEGGWVCGKSGQSVPVSLGLPTVRVGTMTVGGITG
jgi:TldD protein